MCELITIFLIAAKNCYVSVNFPNQTKKEETFPKDPSFIKIDVNAIATSESGTKNGCPSFIHTVLLTCSGPESSLYTSTEATSILRI